MRIKTYIVLGKVGPDGDDSESIVSVWLLRASADWAAEKVRDGRVERWYATKSSSMFPAALADEPAKGAGLGQ